MQFFVGVFLIIAGFTNIYLHIETQISKKSREVYETFDRVYDVMDKMNDNMIKHLEKQHRIK